jgi:hypothetical protein
MPHQISRNPGAAKRSVRRVLTAAVVLGALAGSAPAMATSLPAAGPSAPAAQPGTTAPGFIMSDGRICDPIRHMGC